MSNGPTARSSRLLTIPPSSARNGRASANSSRRRSHASIKSSTSKRLEHGLNAGQPEQTDWPCPRVTNREFAHAHARALFDLCSKRSILSFLTIVRPISSRPADGAIMPTNHHRPHGENECKLDVLGTRGDERRYGAK